MEGQTSRIMVENRLNFMNRFSDHKVRVYEKSMFEAYFANNWSELEEILELLENDCENLGALDLCQSLMTLRTILRRNPLNSQLVDSLIKSIFESLNELNVYLKEYQNELRIYKKKILMPKVKTVEYHQKFDDFDHFVDSNDYNDNPWRCNII